MTQTSLLVEKWRRVPGTTLWASSLGRIKSDAYKYKLPRGGYYWRQLSPTYGVWAKTGPNYGRFQITIRRKTIKVAPLVCAAFKGCRPNGLICSHIDEDSRNNRPENLEWTTQKVNLNMPKIKTYHRSVCRSKMNREEDNLSNVPTTNRESLGM